jgi:hypothetical protein
MVLVDQRHDRLAFSFQFTASCTVTHGWEAKGMRQILLQHLDDSESRLSSVMDSHARRKQRNHRSRDRRPVKPVRSIIKETTMKSGTVLCEQASCTRVDNPVRGPGVGGFGFG